MSDYQGDERRSEQRLSDKQIAFIVEKVIEKFETKANKLGFKAFIGILGILLTVFGYWLSDKIHIRWEP